MVKLLMIPIVIIALAGCSQVNNMMRVSGKIAQGIGNSIVKVADEEDAKTIQEEKTNTTIKQEESVAYVKNSANLRQEPSTRSPVISTIPAGTRLTILEENKEKGWKRVQSDDGKSGWMATNLIDERKS